MFSGTSSPWEFPQTPPESRSVLSSHSAKSSKNFMSNYSQSIADSNLDSRLIYLHSGLAGPTKLLPHHRTSLSRQFLN